MLTKKLLILFYVPCLESSQPRSFHFYFYHFYFVQKAKCKCDARLAQSGF